VEVHTGYIARRFPEQEHVPNFETLNQPRHMPTRTKQQTGILPLRELPGFTPEPMAIDGKPVTGFTPVVSTT
jgi:hypothetical protein